MSTASERTSSAISLASSDWAASRSSPEPIATGRLGMISSNPVRLEDSRASAWRRSRSGRPPHAAGEVDDPMAASLEREHDRRASHHLVVRVGREMQEGPPDGRIASDAARAPDHSRALSLFLPGHRPVNELLLARHGETEWSATGRHTSRTDLPLTGNGRQIAGLLAPRLADRRFALVLTSPLRRAIETCELAGLGDEAQARDDLREWDYGDYEGITTAEIQRRRPGWSLWRDGCPNGEVAAEVGTRADRVIAEVRAAPADSIAFGHGHMLRVLAARWLGLAPEDGALFALATGTLSRLGYEHGAGVIRSWSERPG